MDLQAKCSTDLMTHQESMSSDGGDHFSRIQYVIIIGAKHWTEACSSSFCKTLANWYIYKIRFHSRLNRQSESLKLCGVTGFESLLFSASLGQSVVMFLLSIPFRWQIHSSLQSASSRLGCIFDKFLIWRTSTHCKWSSPWMGTVSHHIVFLLSIVSPWYSGASDTLIAFSLVW